jgi:hypothetical protein
MPLEYDVDLAVIFEKTAPWTPKIFELFNNNKISVNLKPNLSRSIARESKTK